MMATKTCQKVVSGKVPGNRREIGFLISDSTRVNKNLGLKKKKKSVNQLSKQLNV